MIMLTFMKKHGNIRCPGCGGAMTPVELACQPCGLQVRGQFVDNEFASLADDDLHFLRIFVSTEGRIRGTGAGPSGAAGAGSGSTGGGAPRRDDAASFAHAAASSLHDLVDTAMGVGTTVGRAATVIGTELVNKMHREEAGNSFTLSTVRE